MRQKDRDRGFALIPVWTVRCMMCGRANGQIVGGVFVRDEREPPPKREKNVARCGSCDGNLYLDTERSVPRGIANTMLHQAAR